MSSLRNMDTPESRAFWDRIAKSAVEVRTWPAWRRGGIRVTQLRAQPRDIATPQLSAPASTPPISK